MADERGRNVDDDDDDDETTHAMPAYVILLEERRRREDGRHFSHGHSRIEAIGAPRERISPPFPRPLSLSSLPSLKRKVESRENAI